MGWMLTIFAVFLVVSVLAGVTIFFKRYYIGWRCDARKAWRACNEWWQKVYWIWAPQEEKVGLVKAQHPTAQSIPGLYHQTGNASQLISQSNSDLCLNAQGVFTRFEAVDHDLHPPPGAGCSIPPQPLRPAPRPRPSPLHNSSVMNNMWTQNCNPAAPLTPPPFLPNSQNPPLFNQNSFIFQPDYVNFSYNPFEPSQPQQISKYKNYSTRNISESIQMASYELNKQDTKAFDFSKLLSNNSLLNNNNKNNDGTTQQVYVSQTDCRPDYYERESNNVVEEELMMPCTTQLYENYDTINRRQSRNQVPGTNNQVSQIMNCVYGRQSKSPSPVNKRTINEEHDASTAEQSFGLVNLQNNSIEDINACEDGLLSCYSNHRASSNKLQRVSQYIQSLPDRPIIDTVAPSDKVIACLEEQAVSTPDSGSPTVQSEETSSPIPPPPPAPPDPPIHSLTDLLLKKDGQTTGEKIFSVLRSFTSQSYIDTAEFCNSFWSSAPNTNTINTEDGYFEKDGAEIDARKGSDLYSPELNLEAHRTAQEVYNSLQDPPASPLRLKDSIQETHNNYTLDPSLTRTSEDIFNSLEQRRKSMETLNGHNNFLDPNQCDIKRRRSIHDLHSTFDEVRIKGPLSQSLDFQHSLFPYLCKPHTTEMMDLIPMYRRCSWATDPDPVVDETNLFRASSCETVCSDTSVNLKEAPIVGEICIGLEVERWGRGFEGEGELAISVLEAKELKTFEEQEGSGHNTFVRVSILPDNKSQQTRLYKHSISPSYQEKLIFPLEENHVVRTLLIEVFSVDDLEKESTFIGEATLRLLPTPKLPSTTRLPLIGLPHTPQLGELLFSLSYSHTSEKLTIVVVKARNLQGANADPGDYYVKVYLIQDNKKLYIKKTQTRKGEKSPIFNESITFNVANYALQFVQFRLTVSEVLSEQGSNSKTVGHVIVGSSAIGRQSEHWRQMLAIERHPVGMWHSLRI